MHVDFSVPFFDEKREGTEYEKESFSLLLAAVMTVGSMPATVMAEGFEAEEAAEEFATEMTEDTGTVTEESLVEEEAAFGQETAEDETAPEVSAGEDTELVGADSGTCGTLTWNFDGSTLRISGKGAMIFNSGSPFSSFRWDIERIIIEEGVTSIAKGAFYGAPNVTEVSLPDTLTRIGEEAFSGCNSLTSIHIPAKVVRIDKKAISFCDNLSSITIDSGVKNLIIGEQAFTYLPKLTNITIPGGVTEIGTEAFENDSSLRTVTLHEGIQSIWSWCFSGCASLSEITIPKSVTDLGGWMFKDCKNLCKVVIEANVETMGDATFWGCSSLNSVTLPNTLKRIPDHAFFHCTSLRNIVIPEGVTGIGASDVSIGESFEGCTALASVSLPSTLKYIAQESFSYCESLREIKLPYGIEDIGYHAFWYCGGLSGISIPDSVSFLGAGAFDNCGALTSAVLSSSVTELRGDLFRNCANLTSIRIPGSVEIITNGAFKGCVSLSEIFFEGNAPAFRYGDIFTDVIANAYYPKGNATWTADKRQGYGGSLNWSAYTPALRTPSLVSAANTGTGIKVSWNKVDGADGYAIFRKSGNGNYAYVGRTTGTSYNNGKVTAGTAYTYTVRAYRGSFTDANAHKFDEKYWSEYDETGLKVVRLTPCAITSLTNAASSVNVKWSKVTGAKGYYIYRKVSGGSYARIGSVTSGSTTSYQDKNISNGKDYYYAVRAHNGGSMGTYQAVRIYRLSRTLLSGASRSGSGKIALKWNKNVRVSGYQISYTTGSTTKTKTVKGNASLSTTLTGLNAGSTYTIKIRGYRTISGKNYYAGWSPAKTVKA